MPAKVRLRWNGNNTAQEEADKAFAEWRAKAGSRKGKKQSAAKKGKRRPARKSFVRANGSVDYRQYIDSRAWKRKRAKVIAERGSKCEVCGATSGIQVHHKTYKRLGREAPSDLQILCGGCHANSHEGEKVGALDPVTARFLSIEF